MAVQPRRRNQTLAGAHQLGERPAVDTCFDDVGLEHGLALGREFPVQCLLPGV